MHQRIDLIAVLVTVLLTGSELAIGVFVHPVLSKLQDAAHAEAVKPLARLFGRHRDGAITGPDDPEARFYASLIHTLGGTYIGKKSTEEVGVDTPLADPNGS